MTAPIYEVRGASKRFGAVQALDDLDFQSERRRSRRSSGRQRRRQFALIKMMSGIVRPDRGAVFETPKRPLPARCENARRRAGSVQTEPARRAETDAQASKEIPLDPLSDDYGRIAAERQAAV
jgi:ABC-type branched-subunit amino acid transport system ATPase component